ncbi:MAG: nucleotidyl transferase [Nitrospinae bacterium CG11_big_fil_rev_8_21_14_0_20_56_8]|nr:MAG: nucleotidyl transferase [Nitrospinae bacterium CG11_big_fil_rev_8_21_14_0_20_56_8]
MRDISLAVVILAAGKGTRLKSPLAKVLQPLGGRPLLHFILETLRGVAHDRLIVVIGHQAGEVRAVCEGWYPDIEFVEQREQLGTGHAARQAEPLLSDFAGDVLVLCGDMPFLTAETLNRLVRLRRATGAACGLLTLKCPDPKDFGRIIRDAGGKVKGIVEDRDATAEEKKVDEFNAGVYCFDNALFYKALSSIDNNNAQKEFYLTDTISYLVDHHFRVEALQISDADEIFGINSLDDLHRAETILGRKGPVL